MEFHSSSLGRASKALDKKRSFTVLHIRITLPTSGEVDGCKLNNAKVCLTQCYYHDWKQQQFIALNLNSKKQDDIAKVVNKVVLTMP